MVLLDVASKCLDKDLLAVFHLNHNVRPESQADLNFVQKICSKGGIKFYSEKLNPVPKEESGQFRSQEAAWRDSRKKRSQKAADDFGAVRILTAHHATDLVETMIFRLTKGAGPSGLSPFDVTTKPFWQIPKTDLIAYAKANSLDWREDESNQETKHQRNLIRHQVLPVLRQITPNLEKVFVQESALFSEVDTFLNASIPPTDQPFPLTDFLQLPSIVQRTWLRTISGGTPSQSEIEDSLKWLHGNPEGNSRKQVGQAKLTIKGQKIHWQ